MSHLAQIGYLLRTFDFQFIVDAVVAAVAAAAAAGGKVTPKPRSATPTTINYYLTYQINVFCVYDVVCLWCLCISDVCLFLAFSMSDVFVCLMFPPLF